MKNKLLYFIVELILVILIVTGIINIYMIKSTEDGIKTMNEIKKITNIDAILVLGCKANSNGPSEMLAKRLDRAKAVYESLNTKLLLSGDHGTKEYNEVNTMRDYILDSGVDSRDVFLDHAGFSTYDSIYRAKYVFDAKKIVIVTQRFHMYRALYIANKLGLEAYGVVADDINNKMVILKNEIREVLSRDKNFVKTIFTPESK